MSVEALSSDKQSLADEVQRLKERLQQKKKDKTTGKGDNPRTHRLPIAAPSKTSPSMLAIECPVDPKKLPPAAVRVEDELLTVLSVPGVPVA